MAFAFVPAIFLCVIAIILMVLASTELFIWMVILTEIVCVCVYTPTYIYTHKYIMIYIYIYV